MEIGNRIKYIRTIKNIKSNELAKTIGVSPVFLSYIENGTKKPSLETLEKICDALDISLKELFDDGSTLSPELKELLDHAKNLSPEQLEKLTEFIKTLK